jgi:hypothetical protein
MVWTPDLLVSEFMTRDTEPDASNRARYHCNACQQSFPLGNVRDMRAHLLLCPSLTQAVIASIQSRIDAEATAPKRVVRDPRWTRAEEDALRKLDKELERGKTAHRYQQMATAIGRSAQACRQKLLHLMENDAVKGGKVESTKRMKWTKRTAQTVKTEEDDEYEDISPGSKMDDGYERSSPIETAKRRSSQGFESLRAEGLGSSYELDAEHSDATIEDVNITAHNTSLLHGGEPSTFSATADRFLLLVRSTIHFALDEFGISKEFYHSDVSIGDGWKVFVASDIPRGEKDQVIAPLVGAWLDGLDTKGFEVEVDSAIQSVVDGLAEWEWEGAEEVIQSCNDDDEEGDDDDRDEDVDVNVETDDTETETDTDSGYEGDGDSDSEELDEMLV